MLIQTSSRRSGKASAWRAGVLRCAVVEVAAVAQVNEHRAAALAAAAAGGKCLPNGLSEFMPLIAVAHLELDGSYVTVPARDLADMMDGSPYKSVVVGRMPQAKFEASRNDAQYRLPGIGDEDTKPDTFASI